MISGTLATEHDMRDLIGRLIDSRGTQKAVANELGISQAYLHDLMVGKRRLGPGAAERLGWERITLFRKKADRTPTHQ